MRKIRVAGLILLGTLLLLIVYAAVTVWRAYVAAPEVAAGAMASRPMVLRPESLPEGHLKILLAVEDPAFTSHHGVDLTTPGAGYTTLTQGLVKFLYFRRFTPGLSKVTQSFLALGFDAGVDKRTQLTLFLNLVYMGRLEDGREVHGMADAAREYFGKDFMALTRDEFIALVAMIVGPDAYSPLSRPAENAARVRRIKRLLDGGCRPRGLADVYYEDCG